MFRERTYVDIETTTEYINITRLKNIVNTKIDFNGINLICAYEYNMVDMFTGTLGELAICSNIIIYTKELIKSGVEKKLLPYSTIDYIKPKFNYKDKNSFFKDSVFNKNMLDIISSYNSVILPVNKYNDYKTIVASYDECIKDGILKDTFLNVYYPVSNGDNTLSYVKMPNDQYNKVNPNVFNEEYWLNNHFNVAVEKVNDIFCVDAAIDLSNYISSKEK